MWQYSFKLFFRSLLKHKLLSVANIIGLGIAMAAFILIAFYVTYENSFDNFHKEGERTYRLIMSRYQNGDLIYRGPDTYPSMAGAIEDGYAGIEAITKIMYQAKGGNLTTFETSNGPILRDDLKTVSASSSFFNVFLVPIIQGDFVSLDKPFMAMVSQRFAKQIYGNQHPVGLTFKEDDGTEYLITGIFEKWVGNSHLDFDIIKSYSSIGARHGQDLHENSWHWNRMRTYVRLQKGVDPINFEKNIAGIVNSNKPDNKDNGWNESIELQSLKSIHLNSNFNEKGFLNSASGKLFGIVIIGLITLAIGWVNFINLNLAKAFDRVKESGIQKVLGASPFSLYKQHFVEALQINVLAFVIGLSLYQLLLPWLKQLTEIPGGYRVNPLWWAWLIPAILAGSLVSAAYPAWMLSKVNAIQAMKKKIGNGSRSLKSMRLVLSSIQFTVSISLIIAVVAVFRQTNHLRSTELGTRINDILIVKGPRNFNYDVFSANPDVVKNEWDQVPGVELVASSYAVPGGSIYAYPVRALGLSEAPEVYVPEHTVDYAFLDLYDLELVTGRGFSKQMATDDSAAVVNETAVRLMGFESAESALGHKISSPDSEFNRHIIGVVKDFYQQSPAFERGPLLFGLDTESRGYYSIRYSTSDLKTFQSAIEHRFHAAFPGNIYHSFFLDDYFNAQFKADQQLGELLGVFALVAVALSVMGLISMTYFGFIRRLKEMSIRKVLGAEFKVIFGLLAKSGNLSFAIAVGLGMPLTYYLLNAWLSNYANRISLGLLDFALPALLLYAITCLCMFLVVVRSAKANPVDVLRNE